MVRPAGSLFKADSFEVVYAEATSLTIALVAHNGNAQYNHRQAAHDYLDGPGDLMDDGAGLADKEKQVVAQV